MIGLLTVLATIVLALERNRAHIAERSFATVEAETALDSAIRLRLAELAYPPAGRGVGGLMQSSISLWGRAVSVVVEREAGRIDLNSADVYLLTAFFAANGFEEREAKQFADRIIDWRDVDDAPEPNGAEASAYGAAGLQYLPRNGPFETPEEVRQVLGLSGLKDDLLDGLTVYTHAPPIVAADTRPTVRQALQWADSRQLDGHRWLPDFSPSGSATKFTNSPNTEEVSLAGQVVRIHACTSNSAQHWCRVAIARLTGNMNNAFQIFQWRSANL